MYRVLQETCAVAVATWACSSNVRGQSHSHLGNYWCIKRWGCTNRKGNLLTALPLSALSARNCCVLSISILQFQWYVIVWEPSGTLEPFYSFHVLNVIGFKVLFSLIFCFGYMCNNKLHGYLSRFWWRAYVKSVGVGLEYFHCVRTVYT